MALEKVTDLFEPMVSSSVKQGKYVVPAAERIQVPAYLVDAAGSVLKHRREVGLHLYASGESRLQFVKTTTSVKHKIAKLNKMRYACG